MFQGFKCGLFVQREDSRLAREGRQFKSVTVHHIPAPKCHSVTDAGASFKTKETQKMEGIIEEVVAEAKKVEDEVKTEVTNVEKKVETAVAAVETKAESEAKAAGKEVINEMQAVEAEVKKFATEARIVISAEENLMLTKMENAYLKGQMEIRRLTDEAKAISEQYPRKVAALVKKYAINESTHVFNAIEGAFVKR